MQGWEGSGIVVRSGGGFMGSGWKALGKRVAFVRKVVGNEMIAGALGVLISKTAICDFCI